MTLYVHLAASLFISSFPRQNSHVKMLLPVSLEHEMNSRGQLPTQIRLVSILYWQWKMLQYFIERQQ